MGGRRFAFACATTALVIAGCADHGSFEVRWEFADVQDTHVGCGEHGVDSISVTGTSTGGDSAGVTALCVDGGLVHEVPVGTWTFVVRQLDARGQPIKDTQDQPLDATATGVIGKDVTGVLLDPNPVVLTPRAACDDGVDNDVDNVRDGRVDLDDPDCTGRDDTTE